jgi:ABC-type uncharacterized transport system YnjBCD substrate-binding protein
VGHGATVLRRWRGSPPPMSMKELIEFANANPSRRRTRAAGFHGDFREQVLVETIERRCATVVSSRIQRLSAPLWATRHSSVAVWRRASNFLIKCAVKQMLGDGSC